MSPLRFPRDYHVYVTTPTTLPVMTDMEHDVIIQNAQEYLGGGSKKYTNRPCAG